MSWLRGATRVRSSRARSARERGQTLTEFALILPVFLVMTLAVVDAARMYMAHISLTNGVREATMYAARGNYNAWCRNPGDSSQADMTMPVTVPCPSGVSSTNYVADPGNLAFRIAIETEGMDRTRVVMAQPKCGAGSTAPTQSCASVSTPKYVNVSATYEFDFLTPMLNQLWGGSLVLTASSTGRVQ